MRRLNREEEAQAAAVLLAVPDSVPEWRAQRLSDSRVSQVGCRSRAPAGEFQLGRITVRLRPGEGSAEFLATYAHEVAHAWVFPEPGWAGHGLGFYARLSVLLSRVTGRPDLVVVSEVEVSDACRSFLGGCP